MHKHRICVLAEARESPGGAPQDAPAPPGLEGLFDHDGPAEQVAFRMAYLHVFVCVF